MNNELNQIVKVLKNIRDELRTHNALVAMGYKYPSGPLYCADIDANKWIESIIEKGGKKEE